MRNITLLILISSLVSCQSGKKTSELKTSLVGIYEYKALKKSESHYIMIDNQRGNYNEYYFGTEDSGKNGVLFYVNKMENLRIDNGKISFEIGKRDLFETTRFRIVKHNQGLKKDSISKVSEGQLNYSGKISKNGFQLHCKSKLGFCWADEMNFKKLSNGKP